MRKERERLTRKNTWGVYRFCRLGDSAKSAYHLTVVRGQNGVGPFSSDLQCKTHLENSVFLFLFENREVLYLANVGYLGWFWLFFGASPLQHPVVWTVCHGVSDHLDVCASCFSCCSVVL
jgi:hypothetical protein